MTRSVKPGARSATSTRCSRRSRLTFPAEVDDIASRRARGESIIPELDFSLIREGKVSDATKAEIRRRGAVVVRNVFPRAQAESWNQQIGDYLARNDYLNKAATRDAGDRYFTSLKSGRPQIFGIYWSKPQMEARQGASDGGDQAPSSIGCGASSAAARRISTPTASARYADRIRRREPGDASLACRRTWMPGRSNAGWTRLSPGLSRGARRRLGAPTSRSTAPSGPRPRKSPRRRCAAARSAPSRVGPP